MEDIIYNKIYARVNAQSIVTHIFSEAFEQPTDRDICIDEFNTDRHGANAFPVFDESGIANYAIVDGKLVERDKTAELRQIHISTYPSLVEGKIRRHYSMSNELAILRQRDTKPEEFMQYNAYCEECKVEARQELNIL